MATYPIIATLSFTLDQTRPRALKSDILCCAIAVDGNSVAVGCSNGEILIHQTTSPFSLTAVLRPQASGITEPVTCLRFVPAAAGQQAANMMLATCT